jgi:signal transduction histidine kinase
VGRGSILLIVEDDGPGLPPALREQGPARGRRADESTPGHGIGLAMVQEMAEAYGGALRLGSSALGGARLELRLPGRVAAAASG